MRRAPLPLWRPPYRADLYEIWLQVMALPPLRDTRAQALYLKARDLAALTKEPLPKLVWSLATFQPDRDQEQREERQAPRRIEPRVSVQFWRRA
jgi:hypothetical protein